MAPESSNESTRGRGLGEKQACQKCGKLCYPRGMKKHVEFCQGGADVSKPPRVPKARKQAAAAPAPVSLVRRDAPTRVLRIVREPGSRVQTVDDARDAIERLIADCQTTLATLEMMDVLSARVPQPAA
jgi:hypothetical protein